MLEHAFLFFGKGMLTLKCVCTAANPCALEFAVYGLFFLIWLANIRKCKKKNIFFFKK